jgi:AraC-like DNA-binding protein
MTVGGDRFETAGQDAGAACQGLAIQRKSTAMHAKDSPAQLSETHILGKPRLWKAVRAHQRDQRAWLGSLPVCPTLGTHRIAHCGVIEACHPHHVVRLRQSGLYFLACLEGEGRVLVDGRWKVCAAGSAVMLPAFAVNAFHAVEKCPWRYAWVRYEPQSPHSAITGASSPLMAAFDGGPIWHAIEGLVAEASAQEQRPAAMFHWVELIQHYVDRFSTPWRQDDRLARLWEQVAADVGYDWTLDELAARAFVSAEHLRRLCRKALGRTPMHHVTWLRMRKAAELLSTTSLKVETVSQAVGYQNPFVFSNTFKEWVGWRPSEHRSRGTAAPL